MRKKFLGLISILYFGICFYLIITGNINNFIAKQMQIYVKISLIPLLIIGVVNLFIKKDSIFNKSDIILLLPLLFLLFSSDARLTSSFAKNRMDNFKIIEKSKKVKEKKEEKKVEEEPKEEVVIDDLSFEKVDFDVIDETYLSLASFISYYRMSKNYEGKTIRVKGIAVKEAAYLMDGYFVIGRYGISCCAADASFTGFYAKYDTSKIEADKWYEIEGFLEHAKMNDRVDVMVINVVNIKEIKKGDQYVYPCYSYGDGSCKEMKEYNLRYQ